MIRRPARIVARLLSLLAAVLLAVSPLAPAMAKPLDCCPDAPCRDLDKSTCPQVCATTCIVVPAPIEAQAEPVRLETAPPEQRPAPRLVGRSITPEPPPPR
ncbi:hypothetical protein [Caulobacter sp. 1776]|uniref:hypothetical protein n=1 Tax=Caulobacter sp. 1776 TaxID=3156420 RepID=UPI003393648A